MPTPKGTRPWNYGTSKGWTDARGYRWLWTVDQSGNRIKRREHRVIMERHLGRLLEPWEIIHHKDGNPANNIIENLEITDFGAHTAHHHKGARHDADARRSIEAFALMRGELERLRATYADLYAALTAAVHALRSYQYGNASTELAETIADSCDAVLAKAVPQPEPGLSAASSVAALLARIGLMRAKLEIFRREAAPQPEPQGARFCDTANRWPRMAQRPRH